MLLTITKTHNIGLIIKYVIALPFDILAAEAVSSVETASAAMMSLVGDDLYSRRLSPCVIILDKDPTEIWTRDPEVDNTDCSIIRYRIFTEDAV